MTEFTLNMTVNADKVTQFNTTGWKLCFASAVTTNEDPRFNVVAHSQAIAENITIRWTDKYAIAASRDSFNNGIKFEAATNISDINFGQSYTLPPTFVTGTVQNDANAPKAGFRFINQTGGAAAVVYKRINGANAPIYFSQFAPLPKGTEDLTPINKVRVWFSNQASTATMISNFNTEFLEIDFTGKKTNKANYDAEGNWSLVN